MRELLRAIPTEIGGESDAAAFGLRRVGSRPSASRPRPVAERAV